MVEDDLGSWPDSCQAVECVRYRELCRARESTAKKVTQPFVPGGVCAVGRSKLRTARKADDRERVSVIRVSCF